MAPLSEHASDEALAASERDLEERRIVRREAIHERWAVVLVLFVWGWSVGPRLILTLTAPKARSSVGEVATTGSPLASLSLTLSTYALLGLCALILANTLRDPHPGHLGGLMLMLAPWLYLVVRDMYVQDRPLKTTLVYPAVVLAFWILRPRFQILAVLGLLCAVSTVFSLVLGLAIPEKGIFHFVTGDLVLDDKATLPMGILVGYLTHGNSMGIVTVLSVPLVFLIRKEWARPVLLTLPVALALGGFALSKNLVAALGAVLFPVFFLFPPALARRALIGLTLFALYWSASRSSFGAVIAGVLALVAIRALPLNLRRPLGPVIALLPYLVVSILPWITHDPRAFTNRGYIWSASLEWWRTSPWVGLGADWYDRSGQTSDRIAATAFHGHNQMVQFLVTGGIVLVVLMVLMLMACAVRAGRFAAQGQVVGVVYLAVLAGASVLEKPFSIVDNYGSFPVVVLPLAVIMFADRHALLTGHRLWPDVGPVTEAGDSLPPLRTSAGVTGIG